MSFLKIANKTWEYYEVLHNIPEKSGQEKKTMEFVLNHMNPCMECIYKSNWGLIYLYKRKNDDIIDFAIRSELDAIEIADNYFYHGCGHDAHISILLTLADYVCENEVNKNILFIYQGSEEQYGGAKYIASYLKDRNYIIKQIIALHMTSDLYSNYISVKAKAANSEGKAFTIHLKMKGGHMGFGNDDLQNIMIKLIMFHKHYSNDVDNLSITTIQMNGSHNVKPSSIEIGISLRSKKAGNTGILYNKLLDFLNSTMIHGIEIVISDLYIDYEIQNNDSELTLKLQKFIKNNYDKYQLHVIEAPIIHACDDFSAYGRILEIPSLYFFVGAYSGIMDCMHTTRFHVPYESLENSLKLMCGFIHEL